MIKAIKIVIQCDCGREFAIPNDNEYHECHECEERFRIDVDIIEERTLPLFSSSEGESNE